METLKEWLTQPEGLATRLRALRAQAGLSGKDLADACRWAQSKVSRIESGTQRASAEDIEAWCRTCGADAGVAGELLRKRDEAQVWHATFKSRMSHGQAAVQQSYNDLVAGASLIRHFETVYIPGPLQVPDYARRVLTEMISLHELAINDVDDAVEKRMQRQQALYDPAKRWEFLLAEPVLRWLLVPPAVMRAQLDRLQTVIGLERIRFGIVPMGVELVTAPQGSVQIYAGAEPVAMVETFAGERADRGEVAARYGRALDLLWKDAVEGDRARELIVRAARTLT